MKVFVLYSIFFMMLSHLNSQDLNAKMIWNQAAHNAFTDIIRFKSYFYCAFREGYNHVPKNSAQLGKIRILRSKDGKEWKSVASFELNNYDLRDPKLSITPDKKLMVLMGGSLYSKNIRVGALSHVSFSQNGKDFTELTPVSIQDNVKSKYDWLWRITWHKGVGYAVVYQDPKLTRDYITKLLKTSDGINFQLVCNLFNEGKTNEATIRISKNGEMFILVRRENMLNGILGQSLHPYQYWQWKELNLRLGGPNFDFLDSDHLYVGTRIFDQNNDLFLQSTAILLMNKEGGIKKTLELPSSGDTGYPGMLKHRNNLWITYYSTFENSTSIYLSKIKFKHLRTLTKL